MDRTLRVVDEDGSETALRGRSRPDWNGIEETCPDCGAREYRHFASEGGRYGFRETSVVLRSDYWGSERELFTQCLNCGAVLYRHPAFDLLYDPESRGPIDD